MDDNLNFRPKMEDDLNFKMQCKKIYILKIGRPFHFQLITNISEIFLLGNVGSKFSVKNNLQFQPTHLSLT